jgi:hypothetical protein
MLKKFFSTLALTSLLVGGLSVSQANAAAADALIDNVSGAGVSVNVELQSTGELEVAEGTKSFRLTKFYEFAESFLIAQQGRTLGVAFSIQLPNGTLIQRQMGLSTNPTYYGTVMGGGIWNNMAQNVQPNYGAQTIQVPSDATGYMGTFSPSFSIDAPVGQTLPAGTYQYSIDLTTFGGIEVVPTDATGLTINATEYSYLSPGADFTVPANTSTAQINGTLCFDSSKVALGDTVTAQVVLNGDATTGTSNYWRTKTAYKSYSDPDFRDGDFGSSITLTQYDLDWGVVAESTRYVPDLTAGTSYDIAYRLFNQNDEDVSGSCAPAKPATPTVLVSNGSLSVSGQFPVGSGANFNAECSIYDSLAPTVLVRTSTVNVNWANRSSYSCNFNGVTSGKTYLVKFRDLFNDKFSEYSDAAQILIPAAGYTVTSTYAGVTEAKKIVKVSSNVLPIEDYGTRTSVVPDGKGGFFLVGSKQGACPPTCGTAAVRIRHANATSLDGTFAGTGSVIINSFSVPNANAFGMGYYGVNKDKWALPISGYNPQTMTGVAEIILGSATSATTTSKSISGSDVTALCASAASGYAARSSGNLEVSVVGAPIDEVVLAFTCYKSYTIGGSPSQLPLPILATMNPSTGALTFKAAMGTPDANTNSVSVRYSVNPNATSGQALISAFATSSLVTQINMLPTPNGGTVADHKVIRLDSSLSVLSTTDSAWGTSGGQISSDVALSLPTENTGKIFAIVNAGLTPSVVSFDGAAAGVALAVDTTGSEIAMPTVATMAGHAVPSNATVLPVSVAGIGKETAGWIDLSTGVLTTGEVLSYTTSTGNGLAKFWVRGSDKNPHLIFSDAAAPANLTVLKWMDPSYVAPVGAVPAVTSKDVKYSKNTPAAGAKVTLTGTDLDSVISAKIGENAATLGTKTATSLQLTIPTASAAGTVDITLTTADGDTVVDTFTYVGLGVAQTVTVAALASSVTVGDADLTLSAQVAFSPVDAGTAGAITWSSETPAVCSIVANKARLLTAGTCTVKATAAASGVLLAGTDTESTTVAPGTVVAASQTVTLTGPSKVVVDLDGFNLVSSASSGLAVVYSTTTPSVCTVSSTGYVVAKAEGTCSITSTQAGNANWLAASKTLSITVAKTPSTPVTEKGDIKKPLVLSKTGTFLKSGDTQLGWNRSKGTLALKLSVVYIGPVKATASFKVGSKTYTCTVKFGLLKKQSAAKMLTLTAPNLCAAKTEKTQLAALKKITTSTVVTITVVRDMYLPTTYKKVRTKTRILYAKLG